MSVSRIVNLEDWKGSWALVTGASAGLGKEFCRQLAQKGLNLIMVARREDVLQSYALELEKEFAIKCLSIPADLTEASSVQKIRTIVLDNKICVRMLINNAGLYYWDRFDTLTQQQNSQVIALNIYALTLLTHEFLKDLKSHSSSALINISSQGAYSPMPGFAVYGASKAYVYNLSLALYEELRTTPVIVQTLIPGPIDVESSERFKKIFKDKKMWRTPSDVVSISLSQLSKDIPVTNTVRYFHLQRFLVLFAPLKIVLRMTADIFLKPPVQ